MANNNYLWQEFNIKTFPAETIVFQDGVFAPELSTLSEIIQPRKTLINIDKKYDLPVHIIYVGSIDKPCNIEVNINAADTEVFFTAKIQNKKPAFLNIFVKNTGKNSFFRGKVLAQNYSELGIDTTGLHTAPNTEIIIQTKVVAHTQSDTILNGTANIEPGCPDCISDVGFSVMAAPTARIKFKPQQLIKSPPTAAEHSASIYKGSTPQINYLRESGLSGKEVKKVLEEAFINDFMPL